jgi:ABC-2 type transport system permease protein
MPGEILRETLRRNWLPAVYWAVAMAAYSALVMLLTPDMAGLQAFLGLLEAMPPAMLQTVGLSDPTVLTTAEGFVGFAFFQQGIIILSVYALLAGLNITANDEEMGVMNQLLALPVPRWRVVIERAVSFMLLTAVVATGAWIGFVIGKALNPLTESVDLFRMFQASLGLLPTLLTIMGLTAVFGVVIRRRNIAAGAAGTFVAASYLLNTLGGAAGPGLGETLRSLSLFSYFDGGAVARTGLEVGGVLVLALMAVALIAVTVQVFARRDITA